MVTFAEPPKADFHAMKHKIQDYLDVYDGSAKPYLNMAGAFERLFHKDFIHTMDDRPINKDQMRETVKIFLAAGSQGHLLFFKPLGRHTFEVKMHIFNEFTCFKTHSKCTIEDGKIVKLEAYEDAKHTPHKWQSFVELASVKQNLEDFVSMQNAKDADAEEVEASFNRLFYDTLVSEVKNVQLYQQRGMRTTAGVPDDFSQAKFILEQCDIVDKHHIEIKVIRVCKPTQEEVWHDILTVKDGAILKMEPYAELQKVTGTKGKRRSKKEFSGLFQVPVFVI